MCAKKEGTKGKRKAKSEEIKEKNEMEKRGKVSSKRSRHREGEQRIEGRSEILGWLEFVQDFYKPLCNNLNELFDRLQYV